MKLSSFFFLIALCYSCSTSNDNFEPVNQIENFEWTVPEDHITGSGNLYALINNPTLYKVGSVDNIPDDYLVIMVQIDNQVRVYPYNFFRDFEALNDAVNDTKYALTFCPITKSAICIDTNFKDYKLNIRASGYLYKDNMVPLDETSGNYWSQMLHTVIKGASANERFETFNAIETNWKTVKTYFPDALTLTDISLKDFTKTEVKKEVLDGDLIYGMVNFGSKGTNNVLLFPFDYFKEGVHVVNHTFHDNRIVTIGSEFLRFVTSYINDSDVIFTNIQNQFPIVMEDSNGNQWDVFGIAQSGPRKGDRLKSPPSFVALKWAWDSFYPNGVTVYSN